MQQYVFNHIQVEQEIHYEISEPLLAASSREKDESQNVSWDSTLVPGKNLEEEPGSSLVTFPTLITTASLENCV